MPSPLYHSLVPRLHCPVFFALWKNTCPCFSKVQKTLNSGAWERGCCITLYSVPTSRDMYSSTSRCFVTSAGVSGSLTSGESLSGPPPHFTSPFTHTLRIPSGNTRRSSLRVSRSEPRRGWSLPTSSPVSRTSWPTRSRETQKVWQCDFNGRLVLC